MRLSSRALGRGPTAAQIVLQHVFSRRNMLPGHSCSKTLTVNSQGVWDRILSFFCGESHYSCSGLQTIVGIFFFRAIAQMCTVSILSLE